MRNTISNLLTPKGRWLPTLLLLFTFAIGNAWAADVVVTFKGATTQDAKTTALTPTISSSDANITVGACASTCSASGYLISTADGKTAVLGSTTYYLAQPYQNGSKKYWKDAGSNFYGTFTIPSGYTYTIKGVNHALVAVSSGNFSATITVKDATTTKYSTGSLSVASKSSGATITSTAINIAEANWVVLSAGTYTINVTPANTADASTGKYFGMAEVALIGDLAAVGGDPVCPGTLTISSKDSKTAFTEGDAIELTAALTAGNGAITYQWYKGGKAEANKLTGKTAAKLEIASCVEGDAGDYYCVSSKSDCSDAVNEDAFTITVAHNPCATYFWFSKAADATAAGKTNWAGFTTTASGSNSANTSIEIDGVNYAITNRTSNIGADNASILQFTIPTGKAGILYANLSSSGNKGESSSRSLYLSKSGQVVYTATNAIFGDGDPHNATIANIVPGEYTLTSNNNVKVGMFALKVCDAEFHTITLDLDGGTGTTSISALDGAPATKPADPTKENADFVKWVVKSTSADYDWTSNVTGDLTLKAVWSQWPKLKLEAGEGAAGEAVVTYHKAGSSVAVPAKPTGFSNGTKEFTGWVYSSDVEITDGTFPMPSSDLTLTAQWASATAVAQIVGGESYEKLAEAIADVTDGQTIQLLQDIDVDAQIEIAGVDITIDLNGHKIEYVGDATLPSGVILVHNGASLTINDSSDPSAGSIVSGDKAYAAVALTKLGDDASNPATLVVNGGALTGHYYGITGNGSRSNTDITINGGTITGTVGTAIYNPQVGTLTVNNGTLTGLDAAIEMRAGTLVINDGTFTATATEFSCNPNGSGSTTSGAAIAIAQHTTKKEISVTINGGTFNGVKALNESNPQVNDPAPQVTMAVTAGTFTGEVTTVDVNNFISGGTFDHEVAANQCAEGYAPKDNGDNTYGVKPLAQTFSLEDLVTAQGTGANYTTYLNNLGWTVANADALDNLNTDKAYDNYPYLGLKFKNAAGYVAGEVEGGKLLTIKLGHMAGVAHLMVDDVKKMELDGVDAETPKVHYYYVENTANVKLLMANAGSKQTCVLKAMTVSDPFTVTFDANGGGEVASLNGTPSVTLPSTTKGTESFLGWFTEATSGEKIGDAGDSYTPTADITLHAQWEAVSTDARLASITFSSDAGTLSPAFDPEVTNYTYTMPYGTAAVPTITGATKANPAAKDPVIDAQAAAWGETAHVHGVAASDDTKDYYVQMLRAPKDGVCLVKITPTSQTKGTQTGLYPNGDELTINLSSGMNLGGSGKYIGVKSTENFQEGDVLHLDLTAKPNTTGSTQIILYAEKEATNEVWATGELASEAKDYYLTLPAAVNGHNELYIVRTEGNKWNGGPSVMEVTRAMNPMLTAMTIDGRTVTINEAAKTATVTIPYESNLAALTVVPTIVWNAAAATNSIVVNDGTAWVEGPNSYKLTDKDGDYTVYTITLTRDVKKHAVKFYDGETLLETVEVEDATSIAAGDVPADPTKEDYIFQGWAETADGAVVDVTSFTISATKNFYAKWASDGAIKLINKTTGAVNEDGYFITGVTATEANSEKAAAWGGTQGTSISGVNALGKIVQYNATTNQTKLQIKVYNTNSSDKYVYIHKIIEGNTTEETVETLTATSKTVVTSEFYEFNDTENRSFYLTTNSTDVKILQVKVIDDGATPMKQAGEAGYSLNLNKGRVVYYANSDVTFEGLALQSGSNYSVISSSELQTTKNISFSIASPVLLKVTTNTAKYYVSQNPNEDGTTATAITAAGTAEFELTETTNPWYLVPSTTSNVKYTNIAFELPKAATPVIETQPATNHTFDSGDMTATVVATVSEGTLHYQWYKKATVGDDEEVGTDAATLTTTTEGTYYVVVTNVLAGHQNTSVTSDEAELGYRVTNDATLMALSYGTPATAIALEDGVYTYDVELVKGTTDVPALAATATMDGYANVTIDNATEFVSYAASSTVTVKSEDLTVTKVYTVNFAVKHDLPQVDVMASTTWNWANAATTLQTIKPETKDVEQLMANIDDNGKKLKNDDEFNSQALLFKGQEALVNDGERWFAKGGHIKFNVTVPGKVTVEFSDNGNNNRRLKINDAVSTDASSSKTDVKTYSAYVEPGEVTLMGVKNDGTGTDQYIRISKIEFKAADESRANLQLGGIGTVCLPFDVATTDRFGGTFYKADYQGPGFAYFLEETGTLEAGKPYVYVADTTFIVLLQDANANTVTDPTPYRGMYGTFTDMAAGSLTDKYVIAQKKLRRCGAGATLAAYRAYIDLTEMPTTPLEVNDPANAPVRRRLGIGGNNGSTTDLQNYFEFNAEGTQKVIMNGQLYILRDGKMYNAQGQLMK